MINYVAIVGLVGAKLEVVHFASGKKLADLSIDINRTTIGKGQQSRCG